MSRASIANQSDSDTFRSHMPNTGPNHDGSRGTGFVNHDKQSPQSAGDPARWRSEALFRFASPTPPKKPSSRGPGAGSGTGSSYVLVSPTSPVAKSPSLSSAHSAKPPDVPRVPTPSTVVEYDTRSVVSYGSTNGRNQPRGTTNSVFNAEAISTNRPASRTSNRGDSINSLKSRHRSTTSPLPALDEDPCKYGTMLRNIRDAEIRRLKEENARLKFAKEDAERRLIDCQMEASIVQEFDYLSSGLNKLMQKD
ncbi:uncharacterized protein EI90DRAFT_3043116 [Cantharellus anzutake]|uniref:uncharacterized protein n=1 Tax=Cantharellus anzutake TaxID=1750568 RepID=UPI0019086B91|nr:uncharacterized protein EI90DRAFT_3043116 [Cantharellus anzutake]KAF8337476.1 hypothetical protein EI90DRAFT_3043116 [Cantharellus anzutake]